MTTRRGFLAGLAGLIAAPAVVRASSIMRREYLQTPLPRDSRRGKGRGRI